MSLEFHISDNISDDITNVITQCLRDERDAPRSFVCSADYMTLSLLVVLSNKRDAYVMCLSNKRVVVDVAVRSPVHF
jgi:hypothetical protein